MKKAYILVGSESAGNHLFCTLFSLLKHEGKKLLGTDMLGWTDGEYKYHDKELFDPVWRAKRQIHEMASSSFVTSRSVPCGDMPEIGSFYLECEASGFDVELVIIVRDQNIVREANIRSKKSDGTNGQEVLAYILQQAAYARKKRFISFESLIQFKKDYLACWLEGEGLELFDDSYWELAKDENAKYVRQPESPSVSLESP